MRASAVAQSDATLNSVGRPRAPIGRVHKTPGLRGAGDVMPVWIANVALTALLKHLSRRQTRSQARWGEVVHGSRAAARNTAISRSIAAKRSRADTFCRVHQQLAHRSGLRGLERARLPHQVPNFAERGQSRRAARLPAVAPLGVARRVQRTVRASPRSCPAHRGPGTRLLARSLDESGVIGAVSLRLRRVSLLAGFAAPIVDRWPTRLKVLDAPVKRPRHAASSAATPRCGAPQPQKKNPAAEGCRGVPVVATVS
jgi:hypothetical protein